MKRKNNIFAPPIGKPLTSQAVSGGETQGKGWQCDQLKRKTHQE
jgi:hypothetical protein